MCVCTHVHVQRLGGGYLFPSSVTLSFIPLSLSLNLELDWQPAGPSDSCLCPSQCWSYWLALVIPSFLHERLGPDSGLHVCVASALLTKPFPQPDRFPDAYLGFSPSSKYQHPGGRSRVYRSLLCFIFQAIVMPAKE